jgi:hypothetical protein
MDMYRTSKLFPLILLILTLGFFGCNQSNDITSPETESTEASLEKITVTPINPNSPGQLICTELVAGRNIVVGEVCMEYNGQIKKLTVTYNITEPNWSITKTHLAIAKHPLLFPRKVTGRPKLNQFPFKGVHANVNSVQYVISLNGYNQNVYIAAHAVVEGAVGTGTPNLEPTLPDSDVLTPEWTPEEDYTIKAVFDGFGTYLGWGMDNLRAISNGSPRDIKFLSSYSDDLPECSTFIALPENLDLVNWLINNRQPNWDRYTVQAAIWNLLQPNGGISNWQDPNAPNYFEHDEVLREQIVSAAFANGEEFEPACGQKVIILAYGPETDPCNPLKNVVGFEYPVECSGGNSVTKAAWAFPFVNGKPAHSLSHRFSFFSWARYFGYRI